MSDMVVLLAAGDDGLPILDVHKPCESVVVDDDRIPDP